MTGQSDVLREKADCARQQAYTEEMARLEKEISGHIEASLVRWRTDEEAQRQTLLEQAGREREAQLKTLKNRETEFIRQLEEEERRKRDDARRRKEEEERRKRDEEQRRLKKEEETAGKQKAAAVPPGMSKEEAEKLKRSKAHLAAAEALLNEKNYESALAEVSKALGLVPVFPDAAGLQEKIRQAQRTAKEEAEKNAADWAESADEKAVPKKTLRSNRIALAIGAVVLLVAAYIAVQHRDVLFPKTVSVAILPFAASESNPVAAGMGVAIQRELILRMQAYDRLHLLGEASAAVLRHHATDPLRAANLLGFANVVTGSVTDQGGHIALMISITDSAGNSRWSHSYQNLDQDNGSVIEQMAADLMSALGADDAQSKDLIPKSFGSADAFMAYLRGSALEASGNGPDRLAALAAFREGLAKEPESVPFLAGAARVALVLADDLEGRAQYISSAEEYVKKAVAVSPSNPEGIAVRAMLHTRKREYASATTDVDLALQSFPGSAELYAEKARIAAESGRFDDASAYLESSLDRDPRNAAILEYRGFVHQLNGAHREAAADFDAAISNGRDSVRMLMGPIADLIFYEPELLGTYSARVIRVSREWIAKNPQDLEAAYRLARLEQVIGNSLEWNAMLGQLKNTAEARLRANPRDAGAAMLLARAETRLGRYPEGVRIAQQTTGANSSNPGVWYKAAEMYTVQMYSLKSAQIDSLKKLAALEALRSAVAIDFRIAETGNGDFYNFRGDADFKKAIQVPSR